MQWQELTFTVLAVLQAVAPSQGRPHQQQLLYYNHLVPRQSANLVIVPTDAAAIQQFAASGVPLPVGGQYVLVQPGGNPVLYVARADGEKPDGGSGGEGSGGVTGIGFIDNVVNFVTGLPGSFPGIIGGSTTQKPTEDKPSDGSEKEKPDKLVESSEQPQSASLEKFDEDEPPKNVPVVPPPGQRFVVIGQPQFFGNYDALRNHAVQQSLGTGPSFFLVKSQPASGKLQEQSPAPGTSALEFQRLLQQHSSIQQVQQVQHRDDSVTVNALKAKPHLTKEKEEGGGEEEEGEDAENVEANPPGPSVAQVKPQAIALAGPGGMAAAAPIGTAVVGPEGIAVSSPHATAVAGPSGGPPGGLHPSPSALSSPAAYKAYILEQQSKAGYTPGSYHVAYTL